MYFYFGVSKCLYTCTEVKTLKYLNIFQFISNFIQVTAHLCHIRVYQWNKQMV